MKYLCLPLLMELLSRNEDRAVLDYVWGERELTIGGKSTVIRKLEAWLILSMHSPALLTEETRAIRCIRGLGDAVPIRTCSIIQVPSPGPPFMHLYT